MNFSIILFTFFLIAEHWIYQLFLLAGAPLPTTAPSVIILCKCGPSSAHSQCSASNHGGQKVISWAMHFLILGEAEESLPIPTARWRGKNIMRHCPSASRTGDWPCISTSLQHSPWGNDTICVEEAISKRKKLQQARSSCTQHSTL